MFSLIALRILFVRLIHKFVVAYIWNSYNMDMNKANKFRVPRDILQKTQK